MLLAGLAGSSGMPVRARSPRVLSGRWRRLCPGAEVAGAGVPGHDAVQVRPGEGFPAVAAAFVEVGGEPGQEVQAGHLGGGGDGPDHGGVRGGVPVAGAPAFFLVTTGPRIILSAALLSLSGRPDNTNYPDGAVMPV